MTVVSWMGIAVACAAGLGFLSNLLIITVRFLTRRTSTTFQILLATLAFNDLILSVLFGFVSPLIYHSYLWIYPGFACKLLFPTITTLTTVNVGTILFISYERYRAIKHPFKPKLSLSRTCIVIIFIWVIGILSITPNVIALGVNEHDDCVESWSSDIAPKIYSASLLVVVYLIPLIAIATFHVIIVCKLKKQNSIRSSIAAGQNTAIGIFHLRRKRNIKITRLLILISAVFAVCILPNKIWFLIGDLAPKLFAQIYDALHVYQVLFYSHVVMNPVLYSLNDKEFRKDIQKFLCCKVTEISNNSFKLTTNNSS